MGADAVKALKLWLSKRPKSASTVFTDQFGHPLTEHGLRFYWRRHLLRLGIIHQDGLGVSSARYGKNLHEMRDVARSRWQKSGVDGTVAEFFMGHIVDVNDYNKAFQDVDYARTQYMNAQIWLNILSEDPEKVPRFEMDRRLTELKEAQQAWMNETQRRLELLERRD